MTITTRLALIYSAIASSIFIVFGITVYILESNYRQNNFQERLKERVVLTEKMFLEKETFSSSELKKISDEFLHTLPQETEEVIEITSSNITKYKYSYPENAKEQFSKTDSYYYQDSKTQGMSRKFLVNGKKYLIIVTAVDEIGLQNLSYLGGRIILLILIGIPLIFIGGFIITKRALLPLSKKIAKANTIGASNLHQRLNVHNPKDEIGKLATAFNSLLDRLEESFDAQKSFISNASHEINTPLTAIIGEAEVAMSRSRSEAEYIESLNIILHEGEMLSNTTKNLLQLSKISVNDGYSNFEQINFVDFLNTTKKGFDFMNSENQISLDILPEKSDCVILGNENLLKTAIINIFDNACKFSSNGIVVTTLTTDESLINFTVVDTGIGIAKNDIDKLNIPFYRGNNVVQIAGSGIGLSLSFKIIHLHNGTLEIQSNIGEGTTVLVKIPRVTV